MKFDDEIQACNEEMSHPQSGNILGGTYSFITLKNSTLERKNQDSLGFIADKNQALFIIADGIGGHRLGEEASSIAVSSVIEFCKSQDTLNFEKIYEAIIEANSKIRGLNVGAGTTICVGFVNHDKLTFFSSGDSRGVHLSGKGKVKSVTLDHSSAGFALASDLLKESTIMEAENGNQLIYALGDEVLQISVTGPVEISPRDIVLLCSDGLTANLSFERISQIITNGPITDRVKMLKDLATKKMETELGHPDDISIFLFSFGRSDETKEKIEEEGKMV